MADSDNTIKLLIQLGVLGKEDAQAVNDLLAQTKEAGDALAKQMDVVTVSAADAEKILAKTGETVADTGKEFEKSSEHLKKHVKSAREMEQVFKELDRIVPGLGTAMKAAFDPKSIGIVGCTLALETLKSVLDGIKAIDDIKLVNFTGDKDAVDAVRESYEKAYGAAQAFVDEQNRLNNTGLTAADLEKKQVDGYKNLANAQTEFNNAQKGFDEPQIEQNEKKGLISHQQALEQRFNLDVEYARRKLLLESQMLEAEAQAKEQQLKIEQGQLEQAQKDQATDYHNAEKASAKKVQHDKRIETARSSIADAQRNLDELGKSHNPFLSGEFNDETAHQLEEYYSKYVGDSKGKNHTEMFEELDGKMRSLGNKASWDLGLTLFMDHTIGQAKGPEGFAKYDLAKSQLTGAQSELKNLETTQFQVDENADRSKKQLESTDQAERDLSQSIQDLKQQIPQMRGDNAAKINNDAATQNLELRTDALHNGLVDPGNIFKATAQPVAGTATSGMTNPTPWRYDFSRYPGTVPPKSPYDQTRSDFDLAQRALLPGARLGANQTEMLQHMTELITGHAVRSDEVVATLRTLMATQKSRDEAYRTEMNVLQSQLKSLQRTGFR